MKQHNFLVIGLGGTGCAVVRELKKKLYIEWRSRGGTGPYPEIYVFEDDYSGERVESRVATLSVDSNEKDLEGQGHRATRWRVFDETLRLGDREKVLIDPTGIERILGSIERYPGIEPWIRDDLGFVRDITRGSTEPAGCNQIRRMGRLALANGNSISNVVGRIAGRLKELSSGGQVGAEIHIASTLAAGTGSGALIDVIAQLQRHLKSEPGEFEIYVHGFITAKDVGDVNTGNFYANQYAALTELNAFRLASYRPWDIAATASPKRLSVPSPGESTGDLRGTYRCVALLTDTTEANTDVPLENQVDNAAEFVFQMAVRQLGDVPKELRDALTMEDRKQYPADANGGDRSTAFIGYGVQRAAIPEREIREKLSYSFARQFVLKLLYNNWDGRYRETPRSFSRDGFVDARRGLWRLTKEHLYLDVVEDVTGQPAFPSYETEWREQMVALQARVRQQRGDKFDARKEWLTDFDRRAGQYWEKGFRARGNSGGVIDYFQIRRDPVEIGVRARELRGIIERDLIQGMERMDKEYALEHLPAAVEFLIQRVEKDRLGFSALGPEASSQSETADREREDIRFEFQKAGRLAKGKHERLFGNYRDTTVRFYSWRTIQLAAEYAQSFTAVLIEELKSLQQQVSLFATRMKLIGSNISAEIAARIREAEDQDEREEIVFLVDARAVNETIAERFESDKTLQDSQATATMDALETLRGDRFEFGAYLDRMPVDGAERVGGLFVDELRRVAEDNAIEAHRKKREDDPQFDGIFGQNIVRKLYNDFGGRVDGQLEQWLRELMARSMPMVSFDPNEERMDLPSDGPVLRRCVFVPECAAVPDQFEQQLRDKIRSITGGRGSIKQVETSYQLVPEDRNPSELVVISVAFFFPARHLRAVHGLKTKYMARLSQASEEESRRAYFDVHTESHHPRLPDLMKLGRREVLKEQFAPVLLATVLDLMRVPDDDGQQVLFGSLDAYGRVKDKVESGMRPNAMLREATANSEERFGRKIPLETIILHSLYLDQFRESSLRDVARLVQTRIGEQEIDIAAVTRRLDALSGESFLLSGRKEDDETFGLFDAKAAEALDLARRLADRSSLQ